MQTARIATSRVKIGSWGRFMRTQPCRRGTIARRRGLNRLRFVSSSAATVDKSGQRVQRMFGQIAHRYDLLNHLLSGGIDIYWRWRTVRAVRPMGLLPLLDVCTGTGDLALAYRK